MLKVHVHLTVSDQDSKFDLAIDLVLPKHGIIAIYGRSGAGKSTFLKALAGLYPLQKGQQVGIVHFDSNILQDKRKFIAPEKRKIAYVSHQNDLFSHLTVIENLQYPLKRLLKSRKSITAHEAAKQFGLDHLNLRYPSVLSSGEKQKVSIVRALLSQPKILLLDEPVNNLDAQSKLELLQFIRELAIEFSIPVFYVTHRFSEIACIADHLVMIEAGKVLAAGPVGEVSSRVKVIESQKEEPKAILSATLTRHQPEQGLSFGKIDIIELAFPLVEGDIGSVKRLIVSAQDVTLSIGKPQAVSTLNVVPVRVLDFKTYDKAYALVRLKIGEQTMLAQASLGFVKEHDLTRTQQVYAQIASVNVVTSLVGAPVK